MFYKYILKFIILILYNILTLKLLIFFLLFLLKLISWLWEVFIKKINS